ncbi:MAG: hypothetical protein WD851_06355 [Pirellulales bacterium]
MRLSKVGFVGGVGESIRDWRVRAVSYAIGVPNARFPLCIMRISARKWLVERISEICKVAKTLPTVASFTKP